jgi:hypothetical protein
MRTSKTRSQWLNDFANSSFATDNPKNMEMAKAAIAAMIATLKYHFIFHV